MIGTSFDAWFSHRTPQDTRPQTRFDAAEGALPISTDRITSTALWSRQRKSGLQTAKMAKRLPPLTWPRQQRKRRCGSCGKLYVGRPRQEAVCLTCDIRGRASRGENPAAIAVRFGIPRFLVEATLEPDFYPTRTPRTPAIVDPGRS